MTNPNAASNQKEHYYEDLCLGQRYVTGTHVIDEEQIKAFAVQFDPQPFHLDPAAARNTVFEGLVASGWHTAAISMRLMVRDGLRFAGGVIGAGAEITWPNPTRPGSTVHVESEIVEMRLSKKRPDRGVVKMRSETKNQLDEVVQVLVATLIVPRRPAN
jgi:acyl dehydratase